MDQNSNKNLFLRMPLNKAVTISSLTIIFILMVVAILFGSSAADFFSDIQASMSTNFGWLFILIMNAILVFVVVVGFSKFGKIRLGGPKATPEFSTKAWLAMLFSAGMGIGLLFFGVAEPIIHFSNHPLAANTTDPTAAQTAMTYTFLHWGIHGWALYALVGASLAFFYFNRKRPLSLRSAYFPLLGEKVNGFFGNALDSVALVATLFGIATSLGFGVLQFNTGLNFLYDLPNTETTQVIAIFSIISVAALSVYSGIGKGVQILSNWNLRIAIFLLLVVVVLGPTTYIMRSFVQNLGYYFGNLIEISFWSESYWGLKESKLWQNDWTIYYWSWWISWSPFVGMFIARISKGRTLREFFTGVLFVPSIFTFFWMTVFGGSAIQMDILGNNVIAEAVRENVATAIYIFFSQFPFSMLISTVALVLVVSFFVTSADSGAIVIDLLASGGRANTTKIQKMFWTFIIGGVTATLIVNGGLQALQTMVLLSGLPFGILILVMCYSFYTALQESLHKKNQTLQVRQRAETINEVLLAIKNDEEIIPELAKTTTEHILNQQGVPADVAESIIAQIDSNEPTEEDPKTK